MALTILAAVAFGATLFLFVRHIIVGNEKQIVAETPLANGQLEFSLNEAGKYTIWSKRIAKTSFAWRGINNYQYRLFDNGTGQEISLERQRDDSKSAHKTVHRPKPLIENRWMTMYSFEVPAGSYRITFEKTEVALGGLSPLSGWGPFNPFRTINPAKYAITVTPYISKEQNLKNGLLLALYFFLTFGSLLFLLGTFTK